MNKRALIAGILYSLTAIIFKLIVFAAGYELGNFGFYYANTIVVFLLIPFLFLAVYLVREKDQGGSIGGKDALRVAMTVLAVGAVLLSIYNYIDLSFLNGDIAEKYYNSADYLEVLKKLQIKNPGKIKTENFPMIIKEQIAAFSAARSTTAKLFPLLAIGLSGSFFVAVLLKKAPK